MILFKKTVDLHNWLETQRQKGLTIGFVPTMGALHPGHISLIRSAASGTDLVVCSIFVNPTQFNDPKDFEKYPVTLETDIDMLEEAGCTVLFLPSVREMYPEGTEESKSKQYPLGLIEKVLEGQFRPGHFQGVCNIVDRLLSKVEPDKLYLGQKDYQQCMVINKLLELTGRSERTQLEVCPTLREEDGLAMSSRNMRLSEIDRKTAPAIYQSLELIKKEIRAGDLENLKTKAKNKLTEAGFKVDYVAIADADDLSPVEHWDGKQNLVALVAAFLNEVRLIDNMKIN